MGGVALSHSSAVTEVNLLGAPADVLRVLLNQSNNFMLPSQRTDVGALWENFLVSERRKLHAHHGINAEDFFWRTTQQQEVDYIEENQCGFLAWEFKWNARAKARFPKTFVEAYPKCRTAIVTPDNFESFLLLPEDD